MRFLSTFPPFRFLLLAFCAAAFAAGCGNSDQEEPAQQPVLIVSPTTLVFDESDAAKNLVTVRSNGMWTVAPESGLTVDKRSDNGDGSFTVTDAPTGRSTVLTVSSGGLTQTVTVVRNATPEPEKPALTLTPEALEFVPGSPDNEIAVRCNTAWTVTSSDAGLTYAPDSGRGDGRIAVTGMTAGETYLLIVVAGEGEDAVRREVPVTRKADPEPREVVFSLDFGDGPGNVWANVDNAWKTQTGSGSDGVTYSVNNVRIQNDSYGSAGRYAGASGKAYAKMFYDASTDYFTVSGIRLPVGETDFTLCFGTLFPAGDVTLSVGSEGAPWRELTYTGAAVYNTWTQATVGFRRMLRVSTGSSRLKPTGVTRQYGLNFDDLVLLAGGGGQRIDVTPRIYRWAELPSNFEAPAADQFVHTTWTTTLRTGQHLRSYTYCYDTRRHNPVWVAYPHHRCYMEGSGRTTPDPWGPDPALEESSQAKIYPSYPGDTYNYWMADWMTGGFGSGYWSRGHLCMSRERPGSGEEINMQTFRPTNIAPQPSEPSPFGAIWGNIETVISGGAIPADTLYVVAGCYYEEDRMVELDATNNGATSAASKECVMPTHQFKMAVRKRIVEVGKAIQDCTADELQVIAFWVETMTTSSSTAISQVGDFIVPVSFVEEKMGMRFFPDLPEAVRTRRGDLAEWDY